MYEYKVVPIGRDLDKDYPAESIEFVENATLAEALQVACGSYAALGWKLLNSHVEGNSAILIFERVTPESAKRMMDALAATVPQ